MGTTALRQVLRSLSVDLHWTYAVFWKLRHENPMILTWEDGYFDCESPRELAEYSFCFNESDTYSSYSKTTLSNDSSEGYTIGPVMAEMSHLQYAMGEGVVGKAASTGNHYWLSFKNLFDNETNPNSVLECPEEWLIQFAFGIKTILLVPLPPLNGVLQLGSYAEVAEDTEMVAYLKDRLYNLHSTLLHCAPFNVKNESQFLSSPSMLCSPTECTIVPSFMKCEDSTYSEALNSFKQEKNDSMAPSEFSPPFNLHSATLHAGEDIIGAFGYDSRVTADASLIPLPNISLEGEPMNNNQLEIIESKLLELSCLVQELQASSDYNFPVFGDSFGEIDFRPAVDTIEQAKCVGELDNKNVITTLGFPRDSELHKALRPALWAEYEYLQRDSCLFLEDFASISNWIFNSPGDGSEHLLDAVISNAFTVVDRNSSSTTDSLELSTNGSVELSPSIQPQPQSQCEGGALSGVQSPLWTDTNTPSTLTSTHDVDTKQQQQGPSNFTKPRRGQIRKRARPGESKKPRPRDRQLIQDRVKLLREMIPNGDKCSIDSLLEQTIRHMHYLKSVAAQAEKLRQPAFQKISTSTDAKSTKTRNAEHIGTTLAYEFGNSLQPCPIVVEELAYPGHMRIEIACSEHSLFLEIARVIQNLNLTIVKGVLDNSTELTWARFIVEVSKGFHRLEIFWPLMQLLQNKGG